MGTMRALPLDAELGLGCRGRARRTDWPARRRRGASSSPRLTAAETWCRALCLCAERRTRGSNSTGASSKVPLHPALGAVSPATSPRWKDVAPPCSARRACCPSHMPQAARSCAHHSSSAARGAWAPHRHFCEMEQRYVPPRQAAVLPMHAVDLG